MKPEGLIDVLIKEEVETDPRYGCPPEKREIKAYLNTGIVNIDKPSGPNSHQVTTWVKEILELNKTGHSGTLDPKVTGVLPVALGNATKIVKVLLLSDKEYVCLMSLHDTAPKDKLEKVFHELQGPIFQTPPIMCAVKRELRIRNIYELKLLERDGKEVADIPKVKVFNPAFDVTSKGHIAKIVTEHGIMEPKDVEAMIEDRFSWART